MAWVAFDGDWQAEEGVVGVGHGKGTLGLLKAIGLETLSHGGERGDREAYWPSELCW